jgi:hypothetical protein
MSQIRWGITVYENRYLNLSAHMKIYLDWNKQGRSLTFILLSFSFLSFQAQVLINQVCHFAQAL